MTTWVKVFWLFLAGGFGSVSRFGVSSLMLRFFPTQPFWGTFSVNVLGCFLFGLVWGAAEQRWQGAPEIPWIIMAGFLGAFTTFSAYIFDSHRLLDVQGAMGMLLNMGGQLVLGFVAFGLALRIVSFDFS